MLENKDDKKIKNLLDNGNPMRAIKIDFQDLNNKSLVINSSFNEAANHINDEDKKDKWYYIAEMNPHTFSVFLKAIVAFDINSENNYLNLYWIETNRIFKKQGVTKDVLNYLKRYCEYMHLKGILIKCRTKDDFTIFKPYGFEHGNNSLIMKWES